jgi:glycosyltransferase involved in cell wall biosynthesis
MLYPAEHAGDGGVGTPHETTFSVAIPAFNAAGTIGEAVESVLAQTVPPFEIVVCDDGSTDDLETAIAPYLEHVTLVRKENGGEGSAKDAATRATSGDFVVILDADDAFLPKRIEALAELARTRPDLDLLTTDAFLEVGGRTVRRVYSGDWVFDVEDQRRAILERNFVFGAAAIRRKRLLEVGGFDPSFRYAADWDLAIRMILSGSRAGLVDEPLYRYRVGPHALSARRARLVRGTVAVLERAAARPDLEPHERRIVTGTISSRRRQLAQLELDDALDGGGAAVRARAATVLREHRLPSRTRLKAGAAFVAPGLVARARARRRGGGWIGAGATSVAAAPAIRLVAYTDAEQIGGAEISLGHVLAGLGDAYDVTVMGVDERVVARIAARAPGARTRLVAPVRRKYDLGGILGHIRVMRQLRPAIVHVSLKSPWDCAYGILAAYLARARVVLVEQSLYPETGRLRRSFARFAGRRAAAVVAVGDRSARRIEDLVGLDAGSVRTIHNGVPNRPPSPAPEPQSRPVVGCAGRLDHEKAHEALIRALPGLDATVCLVGEGPERDHLERLATELGVADRLVITGWTDDPRGYLPSFTVFCLPSRSGTESFPLSVVEAMLAGLPVVATDVGSVAEAVRDGETGLLVPIDDPEALAGALRRLFDDRELCEEMGRRGRQLALERFTADRMVAGFERLYEEILA